MSLSDIKNAEEFEKKYVHDVYNTIASQFNKTRGYTWSKVTNFIKNIPDNETIADIGCGNGRNMKLKPNNFTGCDIADELIDICKKNKLNVIKGDLLNLPFENNKFDNTICIAVIHHLSTIERRKQAVSELLRITKTGGKIMIQVWALEQDGKTGKEFNKQENFVKWTNNKTGENYERYYYVFKKNELEDLVKNFNIEILESYYEAGNWGVVMKKN
jgi:ubiquinone/menaquinone biosynthesis C-methylase UbiE